MSFLQSAGAGAAMAGAGGASDLSSQINAIPALQMPSSGNQFADGLGRLIGADPSRISQIAGGIGKVSNGIATAGGAPAGYDAQAPDAPQPNNFLQNLNPTVLQAIMAKFGPAQMTGAQR